MSQHCTGKSTGAASVMVSSDGHASVERTQFLPLWLGLHCQRKGDVYSKVITFVQKAGTMPVHHSFEPLLGT